MEKEICGYIYKITNTVNGKIYIGLTTTGFNKRYNVKGEGIERVYNYHASRKRREEPYNKHLLNSIEKYGFEAFEVIKEFDIAYSKEELKEKERYWVSYYKSNDANYGYNKTEGGDSFQSGEKHPRYKEKINLQCSYCGKEIKRLESYKNYASNTFCSKECCKKWRSEQTKGNKSTLYKGFVIVYPNGEVSKEMTKNEVVNYLNLNETTIAKLAREKTCYIGYYEHIRYIRVLHLQDYLDEKELYRSNEGFKNMCKQMVEEAKILYEEKREEVREICRNRTGENSPMYGRKHSEETRKKQSEAKEGKKATEEARRKNSEAHKGKKSSQAKLVVCIFPSGKIIKDVCIKELAKELEVTRDLIRKILNSKKPYKVPNGSKFEYLKPLEGIIIMTQEDYLNANINDNDKAS